VSRRWGDTEEHIAVAFAWRRTHVCCGDRKLQEGRKRTYPLAGTSLLDFSKTGGRAGWSVCPCGELIHPSRAEPPVASNREWNGAREGSASCDGFVAPSSREDGSQMNMWRSWV
jgi:hypothetical protein